ncbi:MAG: hypothetical protein FAF03_12175 [Epsilonproteobacteria bacterium]|nr:hypothetical protein [Campylobacterota bacterium]
MSKKPLKVYTLSKNIDTLKTYLFNWSIWPDFEKIKQKNGEKASLEFIAVEFGDTLQLDDIEVTIIESNHTVDTCGFKIKKNDQAFVLTGDTFINHEFASLTNTLNHNSSIKP